MHVFCLGPLWLPEQESITDQIVKTTNQYYHVDQDQPLIELWQQDDGDHPTGPPGEHLSFIDQIYLRATAGSLLPKCDFLAVNRARYRDHIQYEFKDMIISNAVRFRIRFIRGQNYQIFLRVRNRIRSN